MRPISFKRVSKAQKEEFIREVMAKVDEHVEPRIEREARERAANYVGEHLSLKSIKLVYGRSCTWLGVPVTPDQFEALEKATGGPRRRVA